MGEDEQGRGRKGDRRRLNGRVMASPSAKKILRMGTSSRLT